MKSVFKRIILCSMLILSFAFISACGKDNDDKGNEAIAPTFESFEIVGEGSESLLFNGNNDSVSTLSSSNSGNPFGSGKKTIEEKINEEIDVGEQITFNYTADVNEYIYAITKIKNPSNKVISSITISGQRYSSNLFENESTKEKLIIKLFVGNISSIKNYTLESIKYIDDSSSKDITITGNVEKIVKVGAIDTVSHTLNNVSMTNNSVSFNLKITDNDGIILATKGKATAVLYDGENLIKTIDLNIGTQNITFDGLDPNKIYQYAIVAIYDKLDGNGKQHYVLTKEVFKTFEFELVNMKLLSEEPIINGQTVKVGLDFYNPSNIQIENVYLNDNKVNIVSGDRTTEVVASLNLEGENKHTNIKLTKVECNIGGGKIAIINVDSQQNISVEILSGKIDIVDLYSASNDYNYITSDNKNVIIELNNPLGYDLQSITINDILYNSSLIKIDNTHYKVSLEDFFSYGANRIKITGVTYGINGGSSLFENSSVKLYKYLTVVKDDNIRYISTPDEIVNMENYYVYSLQNNIDLKNIEWESKSFDGVFLGNNYVITNLKDLQAKDEFNYKYLGLFSKVRGGLYDISIKNATINASYVYDSFIYAGILAGEATYANIVNCNTSGSVYVRNEGVLKIGGLVGEFFVGDRIIDSYSTASVYSDSIIGQVMAGGLAGGISLVNDIVNCYATGNVEVYGKAEFNIRVGGLIGDAEVNKIHKCYATGNVTTTTDLSVLQGGLIGFLMNYMTDAVSLSNCYSIGDVETSILSGTENSKYHSAYLGGLVGELMHEFSVENCYSISKVSVTKDGEVYAGGLIGMATAGAGSDNVYGNDGVKIINTYAMGDVSGTSIISESNIGGFIGKRKYTMEIENNYIYDNQVVSVSSGTVSNKNNDGISCSKSSIW